MAVHPNKMLRIAMKNKMLHPECKSLMTKYILFILLVIVPLRVWAQCASPQNFTQNNMVIDVIGSTTGLPLLVSLSTSEYNGYGISCNGANDGWITANVSGGSPEYSYIWSNGVSGGASASGITNLPPGTYSVTVSDVNNCAVVSTTVTLVQPLPLSCLATVTNNGCGGGDAGSINVVASGGTGGYTYTLIGPNGTQVSNLPNFTNLPQGTYTLITADLNNCTCTEVVILQDTNPPIAICQSAVVQIGAGGTGIVSAAVIGANSLDDCGILSMTLSNDTFTCADAGLQTVTLTVTDTNNNTATCSAALIVEDIEAPVAICQNVTVSLDEWGIFIMEALQVNNNSTDNCGIANMTVTPNGFYCQHIGATPVTLTVTDVSGNTGTCSAQVTVQDAVAPNALCKNATIVLNASGNATLTTAMVNNGSNDACGISNLSISQTNFDCTHVGSANTITLTVTDNHNNTATCSAQVTVQDLTQPTALCKPFTVWLNAGGTATITPANVNNNSADACGITTMTLSNANFTCANVGNNIVTLFVTDINGNTAQCNAAVTVTESTPPVAVCHNSVSVTLNSIGLATLTAAQVNNGSTDNCGVTGMNINQTSFNCTHVGAANTITLTVTDANGNTATCSSTITVIDGVAPGAICKNATVQLDALGQVAITPALINNNSADNCGTPNLSVLPDVLTCANLGANTVTLTATDSNGNIGTCNATVTVQDPVAPTAVCHQDVTVTLVGGTATITPAQMNNGSTDNCAISNMSVLPTSFGCSQTGLQNVTLTVTDVSGKTASCTAQVLVTPPASATVSSNSPVCVGGTIELFASGGVSYQWSGPNGFTSTQQNPVRNGATAPMGGLYVVTVTNAAGCSVAVSTTVSISSSATASISGPTTACAGTTVTYTATGGATYVWGGPGGFSANGPEITLTGITTANAGAYTVTVTTANGCTGSATRSLTVNAAPNAAISGSSAVCVGATISLTASGGGTYTWSGPNGFVGGGTSVSITNASLAASGIYTVTVTAANGCTNTATRNVTVSAAPVATASASTPVCVGGTLNLYASGGATYAWSHTGSTYTSSAQNPIRTPVTTAMAGTYRVTVTATGGCTATASVSVTVVSPISASISGTSSVCGGGNITLNATTGSGATYNWNGPAGPLPSATSSATLTGVTTANSGVYTVTITAANGCTSSAQRSVTVIAPPNATASSNSPVCTGSPIYLYASGGTSYLWNGPGFMSSAQNPIRSGATTAMAGTYTVTVTGTGGCKATAATVVQVNTCGGSPVVVTSSAITPNSSTTIVGNGAITLNVAGGVPCSGGAYYTYAWSPVIATATTSSTNGTHTYSGLSAGWYNVTITDCGGNTLIASYYVGSTDRGFKTAEPELSDLTAMPNPTDGLTTLSFTTTNAEKLKLSVYNAEGREVAVLFEGMTEPETNYNFVFDTYTLPAATYFATLHSADGQSKQVRVMVVK